METTYMWDESVIDRRIEHLRFLVDNVDGDRRKQYMDTISRYGVIKRVLAAKKGESNQNVKINFSNTIDSFYKNMKKLNNTSKTLFSDDLIGLIEYAASFEVVNTRDLSYINFSEYEIVNLIKNAFRYHHEDLYYQLLSIESLNFDMYMFVANVSRYTGFSGEFILDYDSNIPYIYSELSNNIRDPHIFAHECGHALNILGNTWDKFEDVYLYYEVPSILSEFLTSYYLDYKYKDQIETYYNQYLRSIILIAIKLKKQLQLYKSIENHGIQSFDSSVISESYTKILKYFYSFLVAKELYEMYEHDPHEMMKFILPLYLPSKDNEVVNVIDFFKITPKMLVETFENSAKRYGAKRTN
jgi:hypothetical protein